MRLIRCVISLLFMFLLVGCSTVDTYQEPNMNIANPPQVATIQGFSTKHGVFDWQSATVSSIDNKDVSDFLMTSKSQIRVLPGPHLFVINSQFNHSAFGGGPYQAILQLNATLLPGITYRLNGNVQGAQIEAWIEDATGKRISSIATSVYYPMPSNTGIAFGVGI